MAIAGFSMQEYIKVATRLGYLNLPPDLMVSVEQAVKMKPREVVIMATGTQGEPSAVLGRLAWGRHRVLEIEHGDTVIMSAHPIPGNEEMVHRTMNKLIQRGATVIYDPLLPVHVSGHASREELKLLINLVRPKFFIPVHGELRHLTEHSRLAQSVGIPPENIAVVENDGHRADARLADHRRRAWRVRVRTVWAWATSARSPCATEIWARRLRGGAGADRPRNRQLIEPRIHFAVCISA